MAQNTSYLYIIVGGNYTNYLAETDSMRRIAHAQVRLSLAQDPITSIVQAMLDLPMTRLRAKRRLGSAK